MSQPETPALNPNYMKVFIQRDYSDGTAVKFQTRMPTELEGRVKRSQFISLFHHLISLYHRILLISFLDRGSSIWSHNKSIEWVFCWGRKGIVQHILWGMFGLHHRIFSLHVLRYPLWKGNWYDCSSHKINPFDIDQITIELCMYAYNRKNNLIISLVVFTKSVKVYITTERTYLQSKRSSNYGSHISRSPCHRNINIGSFRTNMTATFAFNWRIFYVNGRKQEITN